VSEEWAGSTFAPYFVSTMSSRCDWAKKKLKLEEGNELQKLKENYSYLLSMNKHI